MKYLLKKDLPGVKAGTIRDEEDFIYDVEIHKEWFEPIPETPKKPKTVWDLKEGNPCYFICIDGDINETDWCDENMDTGMRECGSLFLTKEDAERELSYRKAKTAILKHHAENSDFIPDWSDGNQQKIYIYFDHTKGLDYTVALLSQFEAICFFGGELEAQQSIKECEKEWEVIFNVR